MITLPAMEVDQTRPQAGQPPARLEIAHVLFADIVGYPRLRACAGYLDGPGCPAIGRQSPDWMNAAQK